jgi:hypothetical protein
MNILKVVWRAAWYELDQPIKLGMKDEFWLVNELNNIRFHTGLDDKKDLEIIKGEVLNIQHKALGAIAQIDTKGLTYKIELTSGLFIIVEAEEGPGKILKESSSYKQDFETDEFQFDVEIGLLN